MKKQKIITIALIVIGLMVLFFFGMRVMRSVRDMHRDGHFERPPAAKDIDAGLIRDWMTPVYIAQTYGVPPEALFKGLEIPFEKGNAKKSLKKLNEEYYPNQPGVVLEHIQAMIQAFQKQEPPPPFPATPVFTPTANP